jgi:hypothetical protein
MTTEERFENLERELARAKRRNRWLLAIVALAVVGLGLAWILPKTTATAQAQGASLDQASGTGYKFQICAIQESSYPSVDGRGVTITPGRVYVIDQNIGSVYQLMSMHDVIMHDEEMKKNNPYFQYVWRPVVAGPPTFAAAIPSPAIPSPVTPGKKIPKVTPSVKPAPQTPRS